MSNPQKGRRACPAAGQEITPPECGAGRVSRFACPATCTFNPWRPEAYGEVLLIQDQMDARVLTRLHREMEMRGLKLAPPTTSEAAALEYFLRLLFHQVDDAGRSFFHRWEAQGFDGLNNDQRILFQAHARMRVRAIEIRTVRDETISEATDVLDPHSPAFLIADRSLASISGRFFPFLAWMYELPYYHRMHGLAIAIPEVQGMESADVVRIVAAHLGWAEETELLQDWLNHHFALCVEALTAIPPVLWEKTMRESQTTRTTCIYRLLGPARDFGQAIGKWPDMGPGDTDPKLLERGYRQTWDWLENAGGGEPHALANTGARPMRASISLSSSEVLLTIPIGRSPEQERAEFERRLGSLVEFAGERMDEVGRQTTVAGSITPRQRELVPPILLRHARSIKIELSRVPLTSSSPKSQHEWMRLLNNSWPDQPVPALDNLSPRQAAMDPAYRPALLALVKERIRNTDKHRIKALTDDDEALLPDDEDPVTLARDLGLVELDVPAPPGLYPPPRPRLPPLPAADLTVEEVEARIPLLAANNSDAAENLLARTRSEAHAVWEALDILREDGNDDWPLLLDLILAAAWYILFPREPPARLPAAETLAEAVNQALDLWYEQGANVNQEIMNNTLISRRQPALVTILQATILNTTSSELKKARLDYGVAIDMAITLRVLIDALDEIARPAAGRS